MSEMVEKVAEKLWQCMCIRATGPRRTTWGQIGATEAENWRYAARAALEAIRVPTQPMIDAGAMAVGGFGFQNGWEAAIDEALK